VHSERIGFTVLFQFTRVVNDIRSQLQGTPQVRPHPTEDRPQPAAPPAPATLDVDATSTTSVPTANTPRAKRPKRSTATSANPPTENAPEPSQAMPDTELSPVCDSVEVSAGGVAVVYGYGIKVSVVRSHLFISDGICDERRAGYLNRATSGLRHLVIISHRGSVSLDAVKWLHGLNASVSIINDDGEVILSSSPLGADHPSLRRAQVLASLTDTGPAITRSLLMDKIKGQSRVLRRLGHDDLADDLATTIADTMEAVTSLDDARSLEARAADAYWQTWESLSVSFARKDQARVPAHWRTFGQRKGQAGSSPRNAKTPANAVLNYLYAILETETRIACLTLGLDPGLGFLHSDRRDRDSLALDLMEVVRPAVDEWLLNFLRSRTFSRSDFAELDTGVVRISAALSRELCNTAPLWRKLIGPVAERVAQQIVVVTQPAEVLPTRLTHTKRTSARWGQQKTNRQVENPPQDEPSPKNTRPPHTASGVPLRTCPECGGQVKGPDRQTFCSLACVDAHNRALTLPAMTIASHMPEAKQKRSESVGTHKRETLAWEVEHPDVDLARERQRYVDELFPRLGVLTLKQLTDVLGCSLTFAKLVRKGDKQPHAMRFAALERLLVEVSSTAGNKMTEIP
jgi:CRISPR-associated endonuclease Cas1